MATVDSGSGIIDPLAPEEHEGLPARLGVGPGLVSGATMLVVLCILSLARGAGLFAPIHVIASVVMGPSALAGGAGATFLGLVMHFAMSVVLGSIFVRLVGRTTRRRQLGFGLFYGIVVWALVQFIALPLLAPSVAGHIGTVWSFFLGHFAYGLMIGASIPGVQDIDAPPTAYLDPLRREVRP